MPAAAIAAVLVTIVTLVSYLASPNGSGAGDLSTALGGVQSSSSVTLLAQERQKIIVMNAAASTMTTAAKPTVVSPAQIQAQQPQDESGGSGSIEDTIPHGEASPSEAQMIAKELMSSFGFSVSSQWECLDEVWTQESSWQWDAENASGAYGIPQSLPAGNMATAGADWQTDATTQIKWGLGYIQSRYGTPCNAWAHEVDDGWY